MFFSPKIVVLEKKIKNKKMKGITDHDGNVVFRPGHVRQVKLLHRIWGVVRGVVII